jgi:hypothetical protein
MSMNFYIMVTSLECADCVGEVRAHLTNSHGYVVQLHPTASVAPRCRLSLGLPNHIPLPPWYVYPRKVAFRGAAYEVPADSGIRYRRY